MTAKPGRLWVGGGWGVRHVRRTAAFTFNLLRIVGFCCFNARNSYNRIFRNGTAAETQLSGRGTARAARRGVSPPPRPHRAEGLPEPRRHLPAGDRPSRSPPLPRPPRQGSPRARRRPRYVPAGRFRSRSGSGSESGPGAAPRGPAALPPRHRGRGRGRRRGRPGAVIPGSRGRGLRRNRRPGGGRGPGPVAESAVSCRAVSCRPSSPGAGGPPAWPGLGPPAVSPGGPQLRESRRAVPAAPASDDARIRVFALL